MKRFIHPPRALCQYAVLLATILVPVSTAQAETLSGQARVIDGDTLVVAGDRIRFDAIDAPETRQRCSRHGRPWACGDGRDPSHEEAGRPQPGPLRSQPPRPLRPRDRSLLRSRPGPAAASRPARPRPRLPTIFDPLRPGRRRCPCRRPRPMVEFLRRALALAPSTENAHSLRSPPRADTIHDQPRSPLPYQGQHQFERPHLPRPRWPILRPDRHQRIQRRALVLQRGRGARRRLAPVTQVAQQKSSNSWPGIR